MVGGGNPEPAISNRLMATQGTCTLLIRETPLIQYLLIVKCYLSFFFF